MQLSSLDMPISSSNTCIPEVTVIAARLPRPHLLEHYSTYHWSCFF